MTHSSTFVTRVLSARGARAHASGIGSALAAAALLGCGTAGDEVALARVQQPIIGGQLDREHPEVMLLAQRAGFVCTGTVIRVERQTGYLLTAAHCVTDEGGVGQAEPLPPSELLVVPGADFAQSTSAFSVQAVSVEPSYDGAFAANDIAVVRFFFGNAPPPTAIVALSASDDALDVDAELLLVGFGQTESDTENTRRRQVRRKVEALDTELVAYSQDDGKGACFGDSGGPGLVQVRGEERVAVVISGGVDGPEDGGCDGGLGVATRVSAYASFIETALAEGG